jgi:nucleoside-diphosphate kinase
MKERTLSIIKPDAVAKRQIGQILSRFEAAGLRVVAAKFIHMSVDEAARFYVVHRDKPFYAGLTEFMSSGPVLVSVLEGNDAIATVRRTMGETDPAKAGSSTIRRDFGTNIERNAVHGSDSPDTARWEISFFFSQLDIQEG